MLKISYVQANQDPRILLKTMYFIRNAETVILISKRLAKDCHRFVKVREAVVEYFERLSLNSLDVLRKFC